MTVQKHISDIMPNRNPHAHKGQCGRVGILAGSHAMPGAAMLTTKAAFRSGAGLVYLAAPQHVLDMAIMHTPELIGIPLTGNPSQDSQDIFAASQKYQWDTFIIGPGLGPMDTKTCEHYHALIHTLYDATIPSVIDADALAIAKTAFKKENMVILTPHEGEFSRIFGNISDRKSALLAAQKKSRQTILLKGKNTLIADTYGYSINPTGNAGMATAGAGDVLSGIIGSLWAQYAPENRQSLSWEAAALGAWLHGTAGDLAYQKKQRGLTASDITESLGEAFTHNGYMEYHDD
jgi:ADP-dependent NAD(P)H-hydrate dehydratase / NAD(P)H-hydrate epimerase